MTLNDLKNAIPTQCKGILNVKTDTSNRSCEMSALVYPCFLKKKKRKIGKKENDRKRQQMESGTR